ncbi:MAG: hypothetical protein K2X01_10985 [Cyanobacteria bacterium]|nr:hypothetical protein [Cyanobacteriota bacterium]
MDSNNLNNTDPTSTTAKATLVRPRDSFKVWLQLWLENFSVPHCAQCGQTQKLPPPYLEGPETVRLCYSCLERLGCIGKQRELLQTELLNPDHPVVIGGLWNPSLKKLIYRHKFSPNRSKQLLNTLAGVAITGWQQTEQHMTSLPSLSRLSKEGAILTVIPKRLPSNNLTEMHSANSDHSDSLLGLNELAKLLSAKTEIPIAAGLLNWRRPTKAQHSIFKRQERILNVAGSLQAQKMNLNPEPKTIIVLDDIRTTGATLQAATEALKKAYPASQIVEWAVCQIPYQAWKPSTGF